MKSADITLYMDIRRQCPGVSEGRRNEGQALVVSLTIEGERVFLSFFSVLFSSFLCIPVPIIVDNEPAKIGP